MNNFNKLVQSWKSGETLLKFRDVLDIFTAEDSQETISDVRYQFLVTHTMRKQWHKLLAVLITCSTIVARTVALFLREPPDSARCIFDHVKIHPSEIQHCSLSYNTTDGQSSRRKRSADDAYQPIRITVQFHDLDQELKAHEQERLKRVVKSTTDKVSDIFRVVPVEGNLLLGRSLAKACKIIHEGKCHSLKPLYDGEYCLDRLKVPDAHLEGLYLWNETHPEPISEVYSPGPGIPNTDYILYVRSLTTPSCVGQGWNTISYAAYCQVDQNNRPVAGFINFCPTLLKDGHFDEDRVKKTALHEMFHALGFDSELFGKFKDCTVTESGLHCEEKPKETIKTVNGAKRLITTKVINMTSSHFGCKTHQTVNEFGPILETEDHDGIKVRSHWDAAFMHTSLMTPNIGLAHAILLDPITLAVFEDSGWYRVNYDYADTFLWGKGAGCNFGQNPYCEKKNPPFFCAERSSSGCHFLQYDKGMCKSSNFLHRCQLVQSKSTDTCFKPENSPASGNLTASGEMYDKDSRCFMSNAVANALYKETVGPAVLSGRCFSHRCNGSEVYVKVGTSPYCHCPHGELIQIPGYNGAVLCPREGIMCNGRELFTTVATPTVATTPRHSVVVDKSSVVCIDILYSKSEVKLSSKWLILFQNCNLETILLWTMVSRRRLENFQVFRERVVFRFDLLPASYSDDGPTSAEVFTILQKAVNNGSFMFFLYPGGPKFVATDIIQMDGGPIHTPTELPAAIIAGSAIGAVAGAILIGVLFFFVQRHYTNHSRNATTRRLHSAREHQVEARPRSHPNTPSSRSNSQHSRSRPPEPPRSIQRSEDPRSRSNNSSQGDYRSGYPHLHQIHAENGFHMTNDAFDNSPQDYPPSNPHRPSISSLREGQSSDSSDFSPPSSRSRTVGDRAPELEQNGVTLVI